MTLKSCRYKKTFTNIWNIKQESDLFAVYRAYPGLKQQAVWIKEMFKQYIHSANFLVASLHLLIHIGILKLKHSLTFFPTKM